MPILKTVVQLLAKPIPRVISPKGHAIADYSTALLFIIGAGIFWKRSKRAAVASLICGATETGVAMLTDYPGGLKHVISFPLHKKIDLGLASMVATMPEFLAFNNDPERKFFAVQGVLVAAVRELTNFEPHNVAGEQEKPAA